MLQRLTHSAVSFALVVVVYQCYALVAVPFLEPQWRGLAVAGVSTSEQRERAQAATHKYRELLSAYFSADHWSLQKPPKTFESGQSMIVLDDYHPSDNGQVKVDRLAILFFPQSRVPGSDPPRDAIVLEAPHGAILQMDKSLLAGPATGAQIQWAKLSGIITIRSDMREQGPHDDFYLTTRDLHITEHMIRTDAKVDMQLGLHEAHGRELEIRLLPPEKLDGGLSIGGMESLEVTRDVVAKVIPDNAHWLMGLPSNHSQAPTRIDPQLKNRRLKLEQNHPQQGWLEKPNPPIQVSSHGPFRFDFVSYIGSFVDKVQVVQVYPGERPDKIHCEELNFFFASNQLAQTGKTSRMKRLPLTRMRPAMIEMKGAPVHIDAPSREVVVRCERMRVEIEPRRATFDGQDEVMLRYRGSEIHAPMVQYQHPPEGSPDRLGTMLAAGSGWLRVVTDPHKVHEPFEVRWSVSMHLDREEGQPVLIIEGRPKMSMVGLGQMWADEVKLYLHEQVAGPNSSPTSVIPDRLLADGRVAIESSELTGRVHHLAVWFDHAAQPSSTKNSKQSRVDDIPSDSLQNSLGGGRAIGGRSYSIAGNELRLQIASGDRPSAVTMVSVDGSVEFREKQNANDREEPLVILADQLRIDHADTPAAKIKIVAMPVMDSGQIQNAEVSARGMTIRAPALELNRGTTRVWIGSPGELEMLVDRDLKGQALTEAQPLTISWQKSMELDQDHITFLHQVKVAGSGGQLQTERMIARLTAPVHFDGAYQQQQPELAQLECWDGVKAVLQQNDAGGIVSHQRSQLESLLANLQTGRLQGDGPGWVESVHLASKGSSLVLENPSLTKGPVQRLRFLRVEFVRGVQGNLGLGGNRREIQAMGQVRAIYGPIDSWQQRLQMSLQEGPGEHTVWIHCEQLAVLESPLARLQKQRILGRPAQNQPIGSLEMVAEGHVIIEGKAPQQGAFTAHARRATYDQHKTMFVLEGNPATLSQQQIIGGPPSESSAQKLIYWQSTGDVKVEGLRKLQWSQFDRNKN